PLPRLEVLLNHTCEIFRTFNGCGPGRRDLGPGRVDPTPDLAGGLGGATKMRSAGLSGPWPRWHEDLPSGVQDQAAVLAAPGAAPAHFFRGIPGTLGEARTDDRLGHLFGSPALDLACLLHPLRPSPVQVFLPPTEQGQDVAAPVRWRERLQLADGI